MEVEYKLTVQDLEAFVRYHLKHGHRQKPYRRLKIFMWLLVVLVPIGILTQVFLIFGPKLPKIDAAWIEPFLGGVFVGFVLMCLLLAWQGRLVIQSARRLQDEEESRWAFGPMRMTINANGFSTISEFHQFRYSWAVVCGIGVTANHAFFYTTRTQATILPRRAFGDQRRFEAFVDQAREYLERREQAQPKSTDILDALPVSSSAITRPKEL